MKHLSLRSILCLALLAWVMPSNLQAEKYQIVKMNCKYIIIDGKQLRKGDIFSDTSVIRFVHPQQFIKIKRASSNWKRTISASVFEKKKAKNILGFLKKPADTRDGGKPQIIHLATDEYSVCRDTMAIEPQVTLDLFLGNADSIYISVDVSYKDLNPGEREFAILKTADGEIVTQLPRTADEKYYIITNNVYDRKSPCDGELLFTISDAERTPSSILQIYSLNTFILNHVPECPEWIDDEELNE